MAKPTYLTPCPRCGTKAFEHLSSLSHCIECLYFEDRYYDHDSALINALRAEKDLIQLSAKKTRIRKENLFLKKKNKKVECQSEDLNESRSLTTNPEQEAS